jgi:two-component system, NtrC family, response regulator HydG
MQNITSSRDSFLSELRAVDPKTNDVHGSFIEGIAVEEQTLACPDRSETGDSLPSQLLREDEGLLCSMRLENVQVAHPPMARMPHELKVLLRISTAINPVRSLETLQRQLLELIFEIIPADRGAILLVGENLEEFASVYGWDNCPELDRPVHVSRTIIHRVLREGSASLNDQVLQCDAYSSANSSTLSQIQSSLCVPLLSFRKVLGVIYLDTHNSKIRFDEDHLRLLSAIAGIAALALENARCLWAENENQRLQENLHIQHNMVGESLRMREVFRCIAKVAPTDSTILILGESGTGKELVARAIHQNSPRANKPFVAINCAALTESLLESELFGHEKGAFTGAITQKKGRLEVATGGTVFLDEVGELAPTIQAKLLRVVQEREFERVGGTRPIEADFRLIVATNRDLEAAIRSGNFRQDLYYRLNVVPLTVPPLRERREDIPLLSSYFVAKYREKCKQRVRGISAEARSFLCDYGWPGNVRELENTIERAVVLGSCDFILPEDLPDVVLGVGSASGTGITKYHTALRETKKQLILRAIKQAGGNYSEAAKLLGVHPNYLHRLIRNLNLKAMIS